MDLDKITPANAHNKQNPMPRRKIQILPQPPRVKHQIDLLRTRDLPCQRHLYNVQLIEMNEGTILY